MANSCECAALYDRVRRELEALAVSEDEAIFLNVEASGIVVEHQLDHLEEACDIDVSSVKGLVHNAIASSMEDEPKGPEKVREGLREAVGDLFELINLCS